MFVIVKLVDCCVGCNGDEDEDETRGSERTKDEITRREREEREGTYCVVRVRAKV